MKYSTDVESRSDSLAVECRSDSLAVISYRDINQFTYVNLSYTTLPIYIYDPQWSKYSPPWLDLTVPTASDSSQASARLFICLPDPARTVSSVLSVQSVRTTFRPLSTIPNNVECRPYLHAFRIATVLATLLLYQCTSSCLFCRSNLLGYFCYNRTFAGQHIVTEIIKSKLREQVLAALYRFACAQCRTYEVKAPLSNGLTFIIIYLPRGAAVTGLTHSPIVTLPEPLFSVPVQTLL
jgi:hypothetical protein